MLHYPHSPGLFSGKILVSCLDTNLQIVHYVTRFLVFFAGILFTLPAWAKLSVLYPQVPSPYDQIFDEIIRGIGDGYDGDVQVRSISKSDKLDSLAQWLSSEDANGVIALGKRGFRVAREVDPHGAVVVGGLPVIPQGYSGISLLADPEVLFSSLFELAPSVNKIHVVYSKHSDWFVNLATIASESNPIEIISYRANDVKSALSHYDEILDHITAESEAIWLPLDPITANEQIILPNLLERTWEKNVVLFSSKPSHAKRGALFSTYPDHFALGQELVNMVKELSDKEQAPQVFPLKQIKLAVNLRTAEHLGFKYKSRQKQDFYLTFPQ